MRASAKIALRRDLAEKALIRRHSPSERTGVPRTPYGATFSPGRRVTAAPRASRSPRVDPGQRAVIVRARLSMRERQKASASGEAARNNAAACRPRASRSQRSRARLSKSVRSRRSSFNAATWASSARFRPSPGNFGEIGLQRLRRALDRAQQCRGMDVAAAFPDRIDRRLAIEPRHRANPPSRPSRRDIRSPHRRAPASRLQIQYLPIADPSRTSASSCRRRDGRARGRSAWSASAKPRPRSRGPRAPRS